MGGYCSIPPGVMLAGVVGLMVGTEVGARVVGFVGATVEVEDFVVRVESIVVEVDVDVEVDEV